MPFDYPLLIADIGGTNIRVGFLAAPDAAPVLIGRCETQKEPSIEDAIARIAAAAAPLPPRSAFLAAAGPVTGTRMEITNATRIMDAAILGARLNLSAVAVVNDFAAQAAAVARLGSRDLHTLHAGTAQPSGTRLAIGPGTGFGVGLVASTGEALTVVPSEGGHAGFGPENAAEERIWPHLEKVEGRITIESVISGDGLSRLHRAMALADGLNEPRRDPATVVALALEKSDVRATAAVQLFLDLMARAAGDLALIAKATGGVFIGGGVALRLMPLIDAARFRTRFIARQPMQDMLAAVPLHVVTAPEPAFLGLAALARPDGRVRAPEMAIWRA